MADDEECIIFANRFFDFLIFSTFSVFKLVMLMFSSDCGCGC